MGNKWPTLKLSEFACNASRRFNFNNKEKVVFINTSDVLSGKFLHKNLISSKGLPGQAKKAIKKGDILFSEIRPNNNRFALVDFDDCNNFVVSTKFMVLEINQEIMDLEFFYLQLTNPQTLADFQHIAESRSGTFPQITFDAISHYPFFCPNKIYQSQIKKVLLSIANKIEICQKNNITLEQMSQTLFKSWFVGFDPVIDNALDAGNPIPEALQSRAELRQKVRNCADFKPLPAELRSLFPSEFEETELGWVPKGWNITLAGEEFIVKGGSTPSTANEDFWNNGTIHWTSPKDLTGNESKVLLDTAKKITPLGLAKISSGLLPIDTVLMSSRAPIGYLALNKVPMAINQGYIAIPSAKHLSPEYTIYWLDNIMDDIKGIAGGTTFAEISKSAFKTIKLLIPSSDIITEFSRITRNHFDKVVQNTKEIDSLTNLRDTLLPKLISGELSLEDLPDLTTDTEAA